MSRCAFARDSTRIKSAATGSAQTRPPARPRRGQVRHHEVQARGASTRVSHDQARTMRGESMATSQTRQEVVGMSKMTIGIPLHLVSRWASQTRQEVEDMSRMTIRIPAPKSDTMRGASTRMS